MIKAAIFENDGAVIDGLLENELKPLLKFFPEIELQADLLTILPDLEEKGLVAVLKDIKDKYSSLASEEIILYKEGQIEHVTVSQLVSRLLLCKSIQDLEPVLNRKSALYAFWEKVNMSILSKA